MRDGVDGFLVPTTIPSPPAGLQLAGRYQSAGDFRRYYAEVAMSTAVDVDACASALARLFADPDLRRRMGASGRLRARQSYDWSVVLDSYFQLWQGLADERRRGDETAALAKDRPPYPLCDDPYRVFASYPSRRLGDGLRLAHGGRDASDLRLIETFPAATFASEWRLSMNDCAALLELVRESGPLTVRQISRAVKGAPEPQVQRTIGYLLKFGFLRVAADHSRASSRA